MSALEVACPAAQPVERLEKWPCPQDAQYGNGPDPMAAGSGTAAGAAKTVSAAKTAASRIRAARSAMKAPLPRLWLLCWLAAVLWVSAGGPSRAEEGIDKMPLALAPADAPRAPLVFADAPGLSASTFSPPDVQWHEGGAVPDGFAAAGVFSRITQTHLGYDPAHRGRYEVSVYLAELKPDRVAPAAGIAVLLASQWGALNFGIRAHDLGFGEVLGGDNASGEMVVNRISVWRRGLQVLILRQKFEAAQFDTLGGMIAQVAGSLRFDSPESADPVLASVHRGQIGTGQIGTGQTLLDFRMPANWARLPKAVTGTPMAAEVWQDAADPKGNAGAMVMVAPPLAPPPLAPVAQGQRPDAVPDQQMFDLAGTAAHVLIENLLPGTSLELKPRDMTSFAALDGITAFNRFFVIDARLNGDIPVVIGVTIVMPADGSTLITASLSPEARDPYLLGTQRHVDLVNALLLEDLTTFARAAAHRQGGTGSP